jgi:GDP-L-fucose synthase
VNLIDKRIVVTGGAGFLGSHIVDGLRARGCKDVFVPRLQDYDFRTEHSAMAMYYTLKPHIVINVAASVGGIKWNQKNPAKALYDNLMIGLTLLEQARLNKVQKFVQIGSVCAYPQNVGFPTSEEMMWDGYPEPTNAPYGVAKRVLTTACQAYREQYGLNAISLIPANLYGPRDNFNLETCHVIPAMIRKFIEAKDGQVTFWGTGKASREFLYVKDCANAIILATERYGKPEPVNIGRGEETTIFSLACLVAEGVQFQGNINWSDSELDGQSRRLFDVSKAQREFGFTASTGLVEGLQNTIKWYKDSLCEKSH